MLPKKEFSNWPYYKNMNPADAEYYIREAAKQKAISATGVEDFPQLFQRITTPVAVYTPDAIANINQHKKDSVGYADGKDSENWLTNALIGMSVADNSAIATAAGWKKDRSGKWVQRPTKADKQLGQNLAMLSTMSPTHPATVAIGGLVGKLSNLANIKRVYGMELNGVKLTKQGTENFFKDLIYGNATPEALAYLPQNLLPKTQTIPSDVYQSIANSTIPRMIKYRPNMTPMQLAKKLDDVFRDTKYFEFPSEVFERAGKSQFGGFFNPATNSIVVRYGFPETKFHEFRHGINYAIPRTKEEQLMGKRAFTSEFDAPIEDAFTSFGDIRRNAIGLKNDLYMPLNQQNALLDNMSISEFSNSAEHANGYMSRYFANLRQKYGYIPTPILDALRYGAKNYGVNTGLALTIPTTFDARRYKNGKDGIYIKPANRGKFTDLKKRTGHSASWFKAHGTPAQKKMAVFALNARKWKH